MVPLPVCRWREVRPQGHHVCHSARFYGAPNAVSAAFCKTCTCADHEPPPSLPPALPCVHLGRPVHREATARSPDPGCSRDEFVCVLHGRCTIAPIDQRQPTDSRSCSNCADYLARDPFGPNSSEMRLQAEEFLAAIPAYPTNRYQGRGVVIAGGGDRYFPSLYVTIRALRHLGCRLPIQVWYLGRKREMPRHRKALLAPLDVECVDADRVRHRYPARRLGGWELKVFSTLHSPFEELLFLDADSYPCRNPEFLFELADYRARGAIFWPDMAVVDLRLAWSAFGVPDPHRLGSIESGQFVLDKRLSWRPLNLAWFYNDRSDYYYRYCHGDKHTFEVAWARCAQPFVMWEPKAKWVNVAYLHPGPDGLPLFVHRCSDKFRFKNHDYTTRQHHPLPSYHSSLPLERECWQWLSELAKLTGRKPAGEQTRRIMRPSRTSPNGRPRFAVATLYTPEMAALGLRTSKLAAAYARRHGYEAVIAKDRIDASRPASWSKLLLIERYLAENPACTWLMWLDADAVIANLEQRLEDLVDENVDFVAAKDTNSSINAGVFLVRNCPAVLEMLRRAYAKVQYVHNPWWEQLALAEAMRECAPALRSRVVSRRLFNSFANEYRQGDFIVHFAGMPVGEKLAGVVGAIAAMAERSRSGSAKKARDVSNRGVPLAQRPRSRGLTPFQTVSQSLHELGLMHGTDKASEHSYLPIYEELLGSLREQPVRLLEIGIWKGSSLLMWADWLPRAEIHGIDLHLPDLAHHRIRMHQHSQGDESALSLLADDYFDVIIDDGSHDPADQLQSIHYLWPKLRTGGFYFVEDIRDARHVKYFSMLPGFRCWDLRDRIGRWDDILVMLRKR